MTHQEYPLVPSTSPSRRFWTRVRLSDGCWEWAGSKTRLGGYGVFSGYNGERILAHRFVMESMLERKLVGDERVLHKCDNPGCVRPDHLRLGTQAENIADAVAKGRAPRAPGERSGKAKLTDAKIVAMRQLRTEGVTGREIARRFGVSPSTVSAVTLGRRWTHIGEVA